MSFGSKAGRRRRRSRRPVRPAGRGFDRAEDGVVEIGPEDRLRRRQQLGRQRRLAPAHHLRVEPRGLHRVGARGACAADQQIAVARRAWFRRARPSGGRRACGGSPRRRRRCGWARPGWPRPRRGWPCPRRRRRPGHGRAPAANSVCGCSSAQRLRTASTFSAARGRISRHEMQDEADAEIDRDRVPRRADAEAVDMPVGEAFDHVGRRQHDEPHVLVGIDAAGRHPEPQLIVVGRERERHAEGERLLAAAPCARRPRGRARAPTPSDRRCRRRPRPRSRRRARARR